MVACTVPNLDGRTAEFLNHLGDNVSDRSRNVSNYVKLEEVRLTSTNTIQYQLKITWTPDRYVQERLKVLQCVANFQGSTHPCRTSVVTVEFEVSNKGTLSQNLQH